VNAVITAGAPLDRDFAQLAGTAFKALAPFRGRSLLDGTIDALHQAGIDRIAVVGGDEVAQSCLNHVARIIPDAGSGAGNVLAALDAWRDVNAPLLYLTCDMPFIDGNVLRHFLARVPPDALAMPLTEHADFVRRFPGAPPAGITLDGERVVNGGAFYIPSGASPRIRSFATQLFDARKAPWRMATIAGPSLLARFAFGRLSIARLEQRARTLLQMNVLGVRNAAPELAFDVDVADEYRYALEHS
jgi:GTP:adenosylcobinamide-phosphate guanylyltransferase